MLIIMVPILVNKDDLERSYNDLKVRVRNCNYFCQSNIKEQLILTKVGLLYKKLLQEMYVYMCETRFKVIIGKLNKNQTTG